MTVRAYVLIETDLKASYGAKRDLRKKLEKINFPGIKILAVDAVTGPFDLIIQIEGEDLNRLGDCITSDIQKTSGVSRATTSLAVTLR